MENILVQYTGFTAFPMFLGIAECLFFALSPQGSSVVWESAHFSCFGEAEFCIFRNINAFKIWFPCELETMFRESVSCRLQIFASEPVFVDIFFL